MTKKSLIGLLIYLIVHGLYLTGCNGLEADVSKKLDFSFNVFTTNSNFVSVLGNVNIPAHDEIDDYVDYAVYPHPFSLNEVSYRISSVQPGNLSGSVDLAISYRDASLDTIPLFQVGDVPVDISEQTTVSVSQLDLNVLSNLVNTQNTFDLIIDVTGDALVTDFNLDIYFDTTIAVDYDEI